MGVGVVKMRDRLQLGTPSILAGPCPVGVINVKVALRKELAYFRVKIFDEGRVSSKSINQGGYLYSQVPSDGVED